MNYLAHLFLARPTADSQFGNLLGDFRRGVDIKSLNKAVQLGLKNHHEVDRFTDRHTSVLAAKALFRKKVVGALHLWRWISTSITCSLNIGRRLQHRVLTTSQSFALLEQRLPTMPRTMQHSVGHMITHDWFEDYAKEEGIAKAIAVVAKRIRFPNTFHLAVDDINANRDEIEARFLTFFPQLITHIKINGPENI